MKERTQKQRSRPVKKTGSAGEILYGINPVEMALGAKRRKLNGLYLKSGSLSPKLQQLQQAARQGGLSVETMPTEDLNRLTRSESHQGVALSCGPLPLLNENDVLAPTPEEKSLLVVLDQVEDPQNFGAIVRSSAVFGALGVVVHRHHAAPLSPSASKASAGHLEHFPVFQAANLAKFLDEAREKGYWIAGTAEKGKTPLHTFRKDRPLIIVLGNEGKGMRPLVEKKCDFLLSIPTQTDASLNVSAAAAVVLYQLSLG